MNYPSLSLPFIIKITFHICFSLQDAWSFQKFIYSVYLRKKKTQWPKMIKKKNSITMPWYIGYYFYFCREINFKGHGFYILNTWFRNIDTLCRSNAMPWNQTFSNRIVWNVLLNKPVIAFLSCLKLSEEVNKWKMSLL